MQGSGRDWRTILLAIAGLGGALLAFASAALMMIYALLEPVKFNLTPDSPTPLEAAVTASAIVLLGAILLITAYYSIRRLRGGDVPSAAPKLLKIWQGLLLFILWLGASALAQVFFDNNILKWFTPPLYLLAIGTPVYFLVRLATGGLNAGSRQRFWGVLSAGMTLGTTVSVAAELALGVVGLFAAGIYVALHPYLLPALKQITDQLSNASGLEEVLNVAGPWLNNPIAFLLALLFFCGFTPIIEETAKSIAAWVVFDHLGSPAQGFVIGALSGAGFGLLESLLASATPSSSWAATLMIRGGSTMMHITAASLTGWGIASFRASRRAGRMLGMYALAMSLHSFWNASVVLIAFGSMRTALNANVSDALGITMTFLGASVLMVLCLAIPLALGMINWRLRTAPSLPSPKFSEANLGEDGQRPSGGMEGVK